MTRRAFLYLVLLAIIVGLAFFGAAILGWLNNVTGTANESGHWYAFWSGFAGSNIVLLPTVIYAYLQHTCHHSWQDVRWGHPVDGTPYRACHKHHPAHTGVRRHVGQEEIKRAYEAAHS